MTKLLYKTWKEAEANAGPGEMILLTEDGILIVPKWMVWKMKSTAKIARWVKKIWESIK